MRRILEGAINNAVKSLGLPEVPFVVEHPTDSSHGDYSTNVALLIAGKEGSTPIEVAEEILEEIETTEGVATIDIAKPGFINFFVERNYFKNKTRNIVDDLEYGKNDLLANQKIVIEYTQPNILKPFHIGHLMSNAIGESLSRLLEYSGAKVRRVNYQSDVGLNIAKAIWGMKQMGQEMPAEGDSPKEKSEFLGNAYVHGATAYEENPEVKGEIDELNVRIHKGGDEEIKNLYEVGKRWSLEHFDELYEILGTKFDRLYFETETAPIGEKIVRANIGYVFEESDGAVVYKGEKKGLHTRVFISSRGVPTYEAKELALPKLKYNEFPYDRSIVITAEEQRDYFRVIMAALEDIDKELCSKMVHITHGMMQLASGKMSSRKGNVVTGESLLTEAIFRVAEIVENREDIEDKDKEKVSKQVAVAAIKYAILRQSAGKNVIYDESKAISFEGNSGPYIQYTYARCLSVLEKAKSEGLEAGYEDIPDVSLEPERYLYQFSDVVERASSELAPHYVANFLTELSSAFNTFYAKEKIVVKDDPYSPYKIAVAEAVAKVLSNGLFLLGIEAPEQM
jgi:arginyl-tRNA synthetase